MKNYIDNEKIKFSASKSIQKYKDILIRAKLRETVGPSIKKVVNIYISS
jgi:hypothetical protein